MGRVAGVELLVGSRRARAALQPRPHRGGCAHERRCRPQRRCRLQRLRALADRSLLPQRSPLPTAVALAHCPRLLRGVQHDPIALVALVTAELDLDQVAATVAVAPEALGGRSGAQPLASRSAAAVRSPASIKVGAAELAHQVGAAELAHQVGAAEHQVGAVECLSSRTVRGQARRGASAVRPGSGGLWLAARLSSCCWCAAEHPWPERHMARPAR